ncbi:CoA transferase subunit A [Microbacterium sp.]|uniref:CoA transferase subunit A n=1 Tax=Microbacterium sp. TaxID=51671 RepID=UPI003A8A723C
MDKTSASALEAVHDIPDGASIAVGGFGLVGVPIMLIRALKERGIRDLEIISNNCGVDDWGLGELLSGHQIRRMISSYVGENKEFARQYLSGEIELEFAPQGTLAERLRAGGSGIPAFYTASGVGTLFAEGGLPWRYRDGEVVVASPTRPTAVFSSLGPEREYVLEEAIAPDYALVRAERGDRHGNLVFARATRAFNPIIAMAGRTTIAEVVDLVEPGQIDPDDVHLPGIYVHRIVQQTPQIATDLPMERRTTRPATDVAHQEGDTA